MQSFKVTWWCVISPHTLPSLWGHLLGSAHDGQSPACMWNYKSQQELLASEMPGNLGLLVSQLLGLAAAQFMAPVIQRICQFSDSYSGPDTASKTYTKYFITLLYYNITHHNTLDYISYCTLYYCIIYHSTFYIILLYFILLHIYFITMLHY